MRPVNKWLIWGFVVLGAACATAPTIYPEHPLTDQIIKARKGYPGQMTNRTCSNQPDSKIPNQYPDCPVEKITKYPLSDPKFRETVNRLNFICNLGGKRFKICLDKPGFCRFSYSTCAWYQPFCKAERLEEYQAGDDYEFLLAANARCANREVYDLFN